MKLKDLLVKTGYTVDCGSDEIEIKKVVNDSRKIEEGCLFICIKGAAFDGHDKVCEAAGKKAAAVLVEREVSVPEGCDMTVIRVDNSRLAMAEVSSEYFGNPAEKMTTIGVTGTKGKTTTTYLIKSILESAGHKVGLVGTIEIIIGDKHIHSENTTPESFALQQYFKEMADCGCDCVVMEVSSQALMLNRTAGFTFDYGIFTNLSPDHIGPNEHSDLDDYIHCKSLLFKQCKTGLINGDDKYKDRMLEGHTCTVVTFGTGKDNDYYASEEKLVRNGAVLGVNFKVNGKMNGEFTFDMPGMFSVYNAMCAITLCDSFNISKENISKALLSAHVKGRMERIHVSDEFSLYIDYAHNAMALESLLTSLREYNPKRIVCLFGCGGNRSRDRRFDMGEVSGRLADFTIITSDNPRNEEPLDIIKDIETGIKKTDGEYIEIPDRKEAIAYAIHNGKPGDVVILAGKGHEDYQEIKGVKYPMDERVLIKEILEEDKK